MRTVIDCGLQNRVGPSMHDDMQSDAKAEMSAFWHMQLMPAVVDHALKTLAATGTLFGFTLRFFHPKPPKGNEEPNADPGPNQDVGPNPGKSSQPEEEGVLMLTAAEPGPRH
jgi:hypothetical protein